MRCHEFLHRLDCQVARGHAFVDKVAFADADSAHDPFIGCVDHLFQVCIGKNAGRKVGTESADLNALKLGQ